MIALLFFSLNVSARPKYWVYTISDNENLWDVTLKFSHVRYWRKIQQLNNIKQPKHILPGTKIKIPLKWLNLKDAKVKVIEVKGEPSVIYKNKRPEFIKAGVLLENGSTLITKKKENALLEFEDNSRILIKENSEVVFDSLLAYNNTGISDSRIYVKHGKTENFVSPNKSNSGTHYQITTPSAVMAVRGTEYRVNVSEDQIVSRSEVLKGGMSAQSAGKSRLIPAKNGTIVKQGEAPSPPIKLLPAPDLSGMNTLALATPVRLAFKEMENVKAYRIEIATDNKFTTLVYDDISPLPIVKAPSLPDGHYAVRVRAIDHQSLEGLNAIHQFEINALPLPPITSLPVKGSIVHEETPLFKWTAVNNAIAYHFQLSSTQDFKELVIDQDAITEIQFRPDQLEVGEYYWRIASIDKTKEQGPFTDSLQFTLKSSPNSPDLETPEISDEGFSLRWIKGEPGQKYHFQLAEDEGFEDVIEDKELSDPFVTISNLSAGRYYVRVATIDTDGYHGEFPPPLTIDIPYSDNGVFYNL